MTEWPVLSGWENVKSLRHYSLKERKKDLYFSKVSLGEKEQNRNFLSWMIKTGLLHGKKIQDSILISRKHKWINVIAHGEKAKKKDDPEISHHERLKQGFGEKKQAAFAPWESLGDSTWKFPSVIIDKALKTFPIMYKIQTLIC